MLGTHRSRRLAALACLLAAGGAGRPLSAQLTAPVGETGPASLISDCDITVRSCGIVGGELYGGSGSVEGETTGGVSGSTSTVCGTGWKILCRSFSAETCAQWVIVEASGKVSFSVTGAGIGGSITQVCGSYVTNTIYLYVYA